MADRIQDTTGPENQRGHAILSISIACGVLETIAVALRFLARRKVAAKYRFDDWLLLSSLIPNYAMIIDGGFRESNSLLAVCDKLMWSSTSGVGWQGRQSKGELDSSPAGDLSQGNDG